MEGPAGRHELHVGQLFSPARPQDGEPAFAPQQLLDLGDLSGGGLVARLDYYDHDELRAIVERAAGILDVHIDVDGAAAIARRSRGTPRIANRLLRRVRDFADMLEKRFDDVAAPVLPDATRLAANADEEGETSAN